MAIPMSNLDSSKDSAIETDVYPFESTSLIPAIHDSQYYQALLLNSGNFSNSSKCEIIELSALGVTAGATLHEVDTHDDKMLGLYLNVYFRKDSTATFKHPMSLSKDVAIKILATFHISPQFLPHLLAEPDYWAPGEFYTYNGKGNLENIGSY
ncbi:hypothetical protein HYFRA_00009445 [Hymenoscyphus fraxineus]|uniref:Uncharacterized protein n=1 Tax=Hymenoscyphus fraxineus TaxID=746836 RepID=A0A9N9L2X8_9HELO|nr:hypothetical protein HYFRA_00009445 [Hymenoscyphus fraxineus]